MKKTFTLLLLLNSLNSFSETINLNLSDSIEKAFEKDKNVKKAQLSFENSELDRKQAFKSGLPAFSYSGLYMQDGDEFNQYKITLTQPIFNGFKVVTAVKNSNKYSELGKYVLENTKNTVSLQVIKTYISILKLQEQLKILNNSKAELSNNYKRVQRLAELELITKTELLELDYAMIDLETLIIQSENSLELSKLNLKNSLGIKDNQEISLKEIEDLTIKILDINLEKDINEAKEKSINAKISEINIVLTEAMETVERANMLPAVNLQVSYGNKSVIKGTVTDALKSENQDLVATLSVSGSLFTWGKNYNAYTQRKNNTKISGYSDEIAKENIELGIKTAYLELLRLDKLKEAKLKALESSKENFRYQKERYENQLIDSTNFLNAENNLRKSEIELVSTNLDLFYMYNNYLNLLK